MKLIDRLKLLESTNFPANEEMLLPYYELHKLLAVVEAAQRARKSKVLRRSGYYDLSQFDEVFAEFDSACCALDEEGEPKEQGPGGTWP